MSSYLLNTHVLLWWLFDDDRLARKAPAIVEEPANDIFVSSASGWEISTKHRLGKLDSAAPLVRDMPSWVQQAGRRELSITLRHAQQAGSWHQRHRDPFDRMIAAQSQLEGLPLLSSDAAFDDFPIATVW